MKKKNVVNLIIILLVSILFILPLCYTKNIAGSDIKDRNWIVPLFYASMSFLACVILICYCLFFKKKYFWLLLTTISIVICNIGYLSLSLSNDLREAILANKIAYFGNVFLPFFLFVTIADACRFRYTKFIIRILFAISCILYIFIATSGYFDLFYKSIEFEITDGIVYLSKTYGYMHTFYTIYIFVYFILMITIIIYSFKKGKIISKKHIVSLLLVVLINVLLWTIEKFVRAKIEYLSLSYVITSILTIYLYEQLNSFGLLNYNNISLEMPIDDGYIAPKKDALEIDDKITIKETFSNYSDEELKNILRNLRIEKPLTNREMEIAVLMIRNIKRKKIAEYLFVTEHTIKFHVSSIYKKTNVTNRNELIELLKS